HYVDKNWDLRSGLCNFSELPGSHSGENVAVDVMSALHQIRISKKALCFTGDNTSNN
ncbi:hypothetical protein BDK51DRAFT_23602, partial [Blyttiomyces helicus]